MWMRWYKDCKGPWKISSIFEILNKKIQHCTSWHHTPLPHLTTPFLHAHDWVSDWRNHTQCSFETSNCAINDMEIISINLIGNYRRVSRDLTSCISALTCTWLADLPKRKSEKLKTPRCKFYAQYSWPLLWNFPLIKSQRFSPQFWAGTSRSKALAGIPSFVQTKFKQVSLICQKRKYFRGNHDVSPRHTDIELWYEWFQM